MALSDLELLQLVERAEEAKRGPQGAPGVGIEKIEQLDETSFTLRLTDGSSQRVQLPAAKDGDIGPSGSVGPRGDVGPAGRAGRDGAAGRDGKDGLPGPAGRSIDTAVVDSNAHLLLGFDDGTIVDVGRVVGPAGTTGATGPTGLMGRDGRDGAAVLSGPRAPGPDDGVDGDHWIDISSAEFRFFKRDGDAWTMLAELRQPARDLRLGATGVSSGGGKGDGGGTLQNTATLPLANPTRIPSVKGLPSTSGLKTQSDYNAWAHDALQGLAAGGGGGDISDLEQRVELLEKALLPWVEFTEEYRTCYYSAGSNYVNASVRMNQYWSSSPAGEWTWAWMVKFEGSDEWTDVDDMEHDVAMSIGYDGTEAGTYLYLYPTGDTIPEIEVRLKVTDSLEGFETVEAWSEPFFPAPVWAGQGSVEGSAATASSTKPQKCGRGEVNWKAPEQ